MPSTVLSLSLSLSRFLRVLFVFSWFLSSEFSLFSCFLFLLFDGVYCLFIIFFSIHFLLSIFIIFSLIFHFFFFFFFFFFTFFLPFFVFSLCTCFFLLLFLFPFLTHVFTLSHVTFLSPLSLSLLSSCFPSSFLPSITICFSPLIFLIAPSLTSLLPSLSISSCISLPSHSFFSLPLFSFPLFHPQFPLFLSISSLPSFPRTQSPV